MFDVVAAWVVRRRPRDPHAGADVTDKVPMRGHVFVINFLAVTALAGHVALIAFEGLAGREQAVDNGLRIGIDFPSACGQGAAAKGKSCRSRPFCFRCSSRCVLTFVLLFWQGLAALRPCGAAKSPRDIALREPNWPQHATQIANAYHNQLELPRPVLRADDPRDRDESGRSSVRGAGLGVRRVAPAAGLYPRHEQSSVTAICGVRGGRHGAGIMWAIFIVRVLLA